MLICWIHIVVAEQDCRIDTAVTYVGRLKIETKVVGRDTFTSVWGSLYLGEADPSMRLDLAAACLNELAVTC